jgi:hypothetical protein
MYACNLQERAFTHTYINICTYAYIVQEKNAYMYVCIYVYIVSMYACIFIFRHMRVCMHACMYTCHPYDFTELCMYLCMHTIRMLIHKYVCMHEYIPSVC